MGKKLVVPLLVAVVVALLIQGVVTGPLRGLEKRLSDFLFTLRGSFPEPDPRIVLVTIDDQTLYNNPYGTWPWRREHYADIIEKISRHSPATVVLTMVFDQPGDLSGDKRLSRVIRSAGNIILTGFLMPDEENPDRDPLYIRAIPEFLSGAAGDGFWNAVLDRDGVVRSVPLITRNYYGGSRLYSLALVTVSHYVGLGTEGIQIKDTSVTISHGKAGMDTSVPLEPSGEYNNMTVNFTGGARQFESIPYHELFSGTGNGLGLTGDVLGLTGDFLRLTDDGLGLTDDGLGLTDDSLGLTGDSLGRTGDSLGRTGDSLGLTGDSVDLTDKIVLIGTTLSGEHETYQAPLGGKLAGVELLANAVSTILERRFLRRCSPAIDLSYLLVVSVIGSVLFCLVSPLWSWAVGLLMGFGLWCTALFMFSRGLVGPLAAPLLSLVVLYLASLAYHYTGERRAFRQYRREQDLLERDIELARRIQKRLMPDYPPAMSNLSISARTRPARSLGGDFYDFFMFDEERIGCVIADISGKGVSAALLMNMIRSVFKTVIGTMGEREDVLSVVNHHVSNEEIIQESSFATCIYLVADIRKSSLTFSNAGHSPALLFRDGEPVAELKAHGVPVGILKESTYRSSSVPIHPGDVIVLYTDGFPEAHNVQTEQFGTDRLIEIVAACRDSSPEEILERVFAEVDCFTEGRSQFDDMTMVVFKVLTSSAAHNE